MPDLFVILSAAPDQGLKQSRHPANVGLGACVNKGIEAFKSPVHVLKFQTHPVVFLTQI